MKSKPNPNSATLIVTAPQNAIKPTNNHHLRRRVQIDCSEPQITDQSYKKSSDINYIMKQYAATGSPLPTNALAKYLDNTLAVPLEDAYRLVNEAKELFLELPLALRKQMDHDPKNLESFILDPENQDQLIKHGLITLKADDASPPASPQPAAASSEPE